MRHNFNIFGIILILHLISCKQNDDYQSDEKLIFAQIVSTHHLSNII